MNKSLNYRWGLEFSIRGIWGQCRDPLQTRSASNQPSRAEGKQLLLPDKNGHIDWRRLISSRLKRNVCNSGYKNTGKNMAVAAGSFRSVPTDDIWTFCSSHLGGRNEGQFKLEVHSASGRFKKGRIWQESRFARTVWGTGVKRNRSNSRPCNSCL